MVNGTTLTKFKPLRAFFIYNMPERNGYSCLVFSDRDGVHAVCLELGLNSNAQRNEAEAVEAIMASILAHNISVARGAAEGKYIEPLTAPEEHWQAFRDLLSRKKKVLSYSLPAFSRQISRDFKLQNAMA